MVGMTTRAVRRLRIRAAPASLDQDGARATFESLGAFATHGHHTEGSQD